PDSWAERRRRERRVAGSHRGDAIGRDTHDARERRARPRGRPSQRNGYGAARADRGRGHPALRERCHHERARLARLPVPGHRQEMERGDEHLPGSAAGDERLLQLHRCTSRRSLAGAERRGLVPAVLRARHLGGPALMPVKSRAPKRSAPQKTAPKKTAPKRRAAKKPYQPKVTPELRARARRILDRLAKAQPDWGP